MQALRTRDVQIEPAHPKLIEVLPEPSLVEDCRRASQLPYAEVLWASHLRVGQDELRWLADGFAALAARCDASDGASQYVCASGTQCVAAA